MIRFELPKTRALCPCKVLPDNLEGAVALEMQLDGLVILSMKDSDTELGHCTKDGDGAICLTETSGFEASVVASASESTDKVQVPFLSNIGLA